MMAEHAEENFVEKQLKRIEKELTKLDFPEIQYSRLIPIDNCKYANKIYRTVTEKSIGYGFGMMDFMYEENRCFDIDSTNAVKARRNAEMLIQEIAFKGDKRESWTGLFNDTNVTALNAAEKGNPWNVKTDDEAIEDINDLISGRREGWNAAFLADTLLLPLPAFSRLSRIREHGKAPTLLQRIKRANIYTLQTGRDLTILVMQGLENAGASKSGRAVAYQCAPDLLKLHLPEPHHFLTPWRDEGSFSIQIGGQFCIGGLEISQPEAVRYLDHIT